MYSQAKIYKKFMLKKLGHGVGPEYWDTIYTFWNAQQAAYSSSNVCPLVFLAGGLFSVLDSYPSEFIRQLKVKWNTVTIHCEFIINLTHFPIWLTAVGLCVFANNHSWSFCFLGEKLCRNFTIQNWPMKTSFILGTGNQTCLWSVHRIMQGFAVILI